MEYFPPETVKKLRGSIMSAGSIAPSKVGMKSKEYIHTKKQQDNF